MFTWLMLFTTEALFLAWNSLFQLFREFGQHKKPVNKAFYGIQYCFELLLCRCPATMSSCMTCLEHRSENIAFILGDFSFNN